MNLELKCDERIERIGGMNLIVGKTEYSVQITKKDLKDFDIDFVEAKANYPQMEKLIVSVGSRRKGNFYMWFSYLSEICNVDRYVDHIYSGEERKTVPADIYDLYRKLRAKFIRDVLNNEVKSPILMERVAKDIAKDIAEGAVGDKLLIPGVYHFDICCNDGKDHLFNDKNEVVFETHDLAKLYDFIRDNSNGYIRSGIYEYTIF